MISSLSLFSKSTRRELKCSNWLSQPIRKYQITRHNHVGVQEQIWTTYLNMLGVKSKKVCIYAQLMHDIFDFLHDTDSVCQLSVWWLCSVWVLLFGGIIATLACMHGKHREKLVFDCKVLRLSLTCRNFDQQSVSLAIIAFSSLFLTFFHIFHFLTSRRGNYSCYLVVLT